MTFRLMSVLIISENFLYDIRWRNFTFCEFFSKEKSSENKNQFAKFFGIYLCKFVYEFTGMMRTVWIYGLLIRAFCIYNTFHLYIHTLKPDDAHLNLNKSQIEKKCDTSYTNSLHRSNLLAYRSLYNKWIQLHFIYRKQQPR